MIEEKILMVANNVKKIDLEKKEITFKLVFPPYLKSSQEQADQLLEKLLEQNINFFSKIPIRGLKFKYTLYSGENL